MTELPANNDAWRRAGADAKPPASGEQIERDVATEPGTASLSPAGREAPERPASADEEASGDVASEPDRDVTGAKPQTS